MTHRTISTNRSYGDNNRRCPRRRAPSAGARVAGPHARSRPTGSARNWATETPTCARCATGRHGHPVRHARRHWPARHRPLAARNRPWATRHRPSATEHAWLIGPVWIAIVTTNPRRRPSKLRRAVRPPRLPWTAGGAAIVHRTTSATRAAAIRAPALVAVIDVRVDVVGVVLDKVPPGRGPRLRVAAAATTRRAAAARLGEVGHVLTAEMVDEAWLGAGEPDNAANGATLAGKRHFCGADRLVGARAGARRMGPAAGGAVRVARRSHGGRKGRTSAKKAEKVPEQRYSCSKKDCHKARTEEKMSPVSLR